MRRRRLPAARRALRAAVAAAMPLTAAAVAVTVIPAATQQLAGPATPAAPASTARTVVSLTFDDGNADEMNAVPILHSRGLSGTFYIIAGEVGSPDYLTRVNLRELAAAGDEIGSHAVSHLSLTTLTAAEGRRQICDSRDILARWGFRVRSFSYPGGYYNGPAEGIVRDCGYTSARIYGDLSTAGCPGCAVTETMPPARPYAIRSAQGEPAGTWTLAGLERLVTAARQRGGWLPIVFHHVCAAAACPPLSVRAGVLGRFAAWLARQRQAGVAVRTVGSVVGGPVRPLVRVPPAPAHGVINGSMAEVAPATSADPSAETLGGVPGRFVRCWMPAGYGGNRPSYARIRDAATRRWALRMTITGFASGDAKAVQDFDLGGCSLPVTAGRSYLLSNSYRATARTQYAVYYRDLGGRWHYWVSSPYFPASSGWAHAGWLTPAVPAGATGLSFGQGMASNGTLVTTAYRFSPARPPGTAGDLWWIPAAVGLAVAAGLGWAAARRRRRQRRPAGSPRG